MQLEKHGIKSLAEFVRALEPVKSIVNLPRHARPLREGQFPGGIFILLCGNVRLSVSLKSGKNLVLQVVGSGEVLGLSATMLGKPAEYTAETLDPVQFLYVSRKDFMDLINREPQVCSSAVEILSHQLREAMNMIRYSSGSERAIGKLAELLDSGVVGKGEVTDRGIELKLLVTQDESGRMAGVSRGRTSRLLTELEEQGLLKREGGRLRLLKGHILDELQMGKSRKVDEENWYETSE